MPILNYWLIWNKSMRLKKIQVTRRRDNINIPHIVNRQNTEEKIILCSYVTFYIYRIDQAKATNSF